MKNIFLSSKFLIISSAIILAGLSRLIPHLPNFTPLAAMSLFGGALLNDKKLAFIIPIAAMILSDAIIGFHQQMWGVYLSFVLIIMIGLRAGSNIKTSSMIGNSLVGSVVFFIITNFAVWLPGNFYPLSLSGLFECYVAAIPFFGNSILGDLFYNTVLFGGFFLIKQRIPALVKA